METPVNEIRIDLRGNPKLKEFFSRKEDGGECHVEITFSKKTITADGVLLGVMTMIAPNGYESSPQESGGEVEKDVEPNADEPVMVMIAGARENKKPEPEPAYA